MSQLIHKEWIHESNRVSTVYREGVDDFIDLAKKKYEGFTTCPCPCVTCRNGKRLVFDEVRRHIVQNGFDITYTIWSLHGEKRSKYPVVDIVEDENIEDRGLGLENLVDACHGVYKGVRGDVYGGASGDTSNFEQPFVLELDLGKKYAEYKSKAEEKLYPSCEGPVTTLSAVVELHDLKKQYGWSENSVSALLSMLRTWLPKENTLPEKWSVMKKMLTDLGMKAKRIDACENNCILYYGTKKDLMICPHCESPTYKVEGKIGKESKVPKKVLRHFPLGPRLQRLYTIPSIAREMTWHARATPSWNYMRHPVDSVQWTKFKERWPEFANEGRNVWLAVATDGFNPRGIQSTGYSCWPVILVPYNLPPSLCMKSDFQMMSLLIPGPKAPTTDIDVFLEPLFDELDQLWREGVPAFDMHKREHFTLKAMLMWGIHDFPALGNLSGCVTHGYKACPVCGDNTPSEHLPCSKKIVYTNYRLFLDPEHPFRYNKHFNGKQELNLPPSHLKGTDIEKLLSRVKYVPGKIQKGSKRSRIDGSVNVVDRDDNDDDDDDDDKDDDDGLEVTEAFYRRSILFKLLYWPSHKVRHCIDVMHDEKNVSEHILYLILDLKKTKDTVAAREDLKIKGIHSSLWMQEDLHTGRQKKPMASYVLDTNEKKHFFQILKDLKLPSRFSSNLGNIVGSNPYSLLTMKSHDHHVIMQYVLPVLLQHAFPKNRDLRRAFHQISLFFRILCSKVLSRNDMECAKIMIVEALCILEKHLPPSFFDISIHLMVHLADEALICGPVWPRWMYPFERAMKECKNIPSNKRYVEGSIIESYIVSESVRYAMEYMPRGENKKLTRKRYLDENGEIIDEGPLLDFKVVMLETAQWIQIRRWLIFRLQVERLDEFYNEYRNLQPTTCGRGRGITKSEVEIQTEFIVWLYSKLLIAKDTQGDLWQFVKGPMHKAKSYKKYRINGFVFSTKSHDDTVVTQDSGVCMKAITSFTASKKDKNPIDSETMWYGVIKQILELDYTTFHEVVFYCDWVRVEDKTNGCKLCPDSNLVMVNFNRLKSVDHQLDEPVILASEASQVFYSKDLKNPDWWVVIHPPTRLSSNIDDLEAPTEVQSIFDDQPNLLPLMQKVRK